MKFDLLPKKRLGRKFITLGIILFPLFSSLYVVSIFSSKLISNALSLPVLLIAVASLILFIVGIIFVKTGTDKEPKRLKKGFRYALYVLALLYTVGGYSILGLLYLPGTGFKDWLITTAMTTMNHQYFATWFYNDYDINICMANNSVMESGEDTNPDLINFTEPDFNQVTYKNKFEKEVLTKDEGNDLYKIIDLDSKRYGFKGKLAVVYDASHVKLGISKGTGTSLGGSYGQFITEIASRYKAVLAINAGGFYDPNWNSTGGVPHGVVISGGKLIANNSKATSTGGIIGFNKDNKLILARMSAQEALRAGIRDCVDFGPFLIVNGKSSYVNGNGGWGTAPRSAIGQRADGIVLLLVIDGRQVGSAGADMNDVVKVLLDYGAINAANLDGGTSTAMELNGQIISNPRNGAFQAKTRPVPNAWIVVP
ncbi:MAG: phosphodiester glycosidase family protein [Bacilli bacterium]|nr:phosphodiester glycosidase family protein [Bacilli bacterium]